MDLISLNVWKDNPFLCPCPSKHTSTLWLMKFINTIWVQQNLLKSIKMYSLSTFLAEEIFYLRIYTFSLKKARRSMLKKKWYSLLCSCTEVHLEFFFLWKSLWGIEKAVITNLICYFEFQNHYDPFFSRIWYNELNLKYQLLKIVISSYRICYNKFRRKKNWDNKFFYNLWWE